MGNLSLQNMDNFEGALVGPEGNLKGRSLEKFCQSLWSGKSSRPRILYETPQSSDHLEECLSNADTAILNVENVKNCPQC